jgi:hypothetical protein
MVLFFIIVCLMLVLTELIKGLSANGTPPVLQNYFWQMDLAYFMWSNIKIFRTILMIVIAYLFWQMTIEERSSVIILGIISLVLWGFIYWFFNHHWVGKKKFHLLKNPVYTTAINNKIADNEQIMGVNWNGVQKAYPISMLFYHHQVTDYIAGHPIWVTYCGLCRSGRVYDILIDGKPLELTLAGAVNYNAVFKDSTTGSWWRQEMGDAVKGKHKGKVLSDIPMEQMTLKDWLAKHPNSEVLQYDQAYAKKYEIRNAIMNYEASLPGWHMQKTPPLIIGIEINGKSKAYDWNQLQKKRIVIDLVANTPLLLLSSEDGASHFVYDRTVDGETLNFELNNSTLIDTNTQSLWNIYGRCIEGKFKGEELNIVQNYQQFIRAWIKFHPDSTYYSF